MDEENHCQSLLFISTNSCYIGYFYTRVRYDTPLYFTFGDAMCPKSSEDPYYYIPDAYFHGLRWKAEQPSLIIHQKNQRKDANKFEAARGFL